MIPGECIGVTKTSCMECGEDMKIGVYSSAAGFYVGFFCPNDGPYSRESGYFASHGEAQAAIDSGDYGR